MSKFNENGCVIGIPSGIVVNVNDKQLTDLITENVVMWMSGYDKTIIRNWTFFDKEYEKVISIIEKSSNLKKFESFNKIKKSKC